MNKTLDSLGVKEEITKGVAYTRDIYDFAFCAAVFDMLHAGHINLLEQMRMAAYKTIIFLHDDLSTFKNKNKFPVQSFEHRKRNLLDSGLVDEVFKVNDPDPSKIFEEWTGQGKKNVDKRYIYMRGDDWKDFPGREVIEEREIPIVFVPYTKGISSTKLRDEISKK